MVDFWNDLIYARRNYNVTWSVVELSLACCDLQVNSGDPLVKEKSAFSMMSLYDSSNDDFLDKKFSNQIVFNISPYLDFLTKQMNNMLLILSVDISILLIDTI